MAKDQRVSVAAAADFFGTPDARRLIQRLWREGAFRLQGVRPGESEPVEIPFNEGGRVDCKKSRIVIGRLCTTYLNVTMKWPDVERLAQADVRRLAQAEVERLALEATQSATSAAPPKQAPQGASNADILEAEAGPLVKAVALELRRHFPEGRPRGLTRDKLMQGVHKKSGGKIDVFSPATLDRALALAWPRAKPSRAQKAAKPPR